MLAVYLACRLRGATFVVDWHNFTYSILELRFGTNSVITKLARWSAFPCEGIIAVSPLLCNSVFRRVFMHVCVNVCVYR